MIKHRSVRVSALAVLCALLLTITAGVAFAAVIEGNNGPNRLVGTERADTIRGFGGNDKIFGFNGGDALHGHNGADRLSGYGGADTLYGGTGSDDLRPGPGKDRIIAASGNDLVYAAGDGQRDTITCGTGTDRAIIDLGDVVDGELINSIRDLGGRLIGAVGSCERVELRILQ